LAGDQVGQLGHVGHVGQGLAIGRVGGAATAKGAEGRRLALSLILRFCGDGVETEGRRATKFAKSANTAKSAK
jgi:hypothetical protein